jgi:hypothetical protein
MEAEGEIVKKYRMSYWGEFLGSWDTATELLKEHATHRDLIKPVTDPNGKGRYEFRTGREKVLTLQQMRQLAKREAE